MPTAVGSPRTPLRKRQAHGALFSGRVVLATVSMEHTLLELSRELVSLSADLDIRLPQANQHSFRPSGRRPCIFIGRSDDGDYRVVPMGTFSGTAPEDWNRLLFEVALPVGDDEAQIPPALRGRTLYDSIPPWVPSMSLPAYILPWIVTLPASCRLQPLVAVVPEADVKTLEVHCQDLAQRMVSENRPEAISALINSFLRYRKQQRKTQKKKKSHTNATSDVERPPSQCSLSEFSDSGSSIASTSTLNPMAEVFVPRFLSSSSASSEPSDATGTGANDSDSDHGPRVSLLHFHRNKTPVRARSARKSTAAQAVPVDPEAEKENVPACS